MVSEEIVEFGISLEGFEDDFKEAVNLMDVEGKEARDTAMAKQHASGAGLDIGDTVVDTHSMEQGLDIPAQSHDRGSSRGR